MIHGANFFKSVFILEYVGRNNSNTSKGKTYFKGEFEWAKK